jgi:hypothetical protein
MKRGADAGLGGGFVSGAMMNWRSTVNVIGPTFFGALYAYGSARNFPGLPFLFAAASNLMAQVVFSTLTDDELGIEAIGAPQLPSDFPTTSRDVTHEFLSAALKAKVKGFRISPIGMGFVCDAFKCEIQYSNGAAAGPASVVLKMPKDITTNKDVTQAQQAAFFRLEAAWCASPTPRPCHSHMSSTLE